MLHVGNGEKEGGWRRGKHYTSLHGVNVQLHTLRLELTFASLDALKPPVINVGVTDTSAVSEPRTAATAATSFARFLDSAAFEAYRTGGRRHQCWCFVCRH